ncbi:hypothetical protein LZQ00_02535 [Sphingobacterium sp. SRCM116780]|uniref:hypothetical protein n=1 Tax=Sphingobacterium sp. SRCM116780 TaxID=2907623 RepID=UPI001F17E3B0|nr:hypothetical protein [Sphingobacterium sp. SRCM116780]UIR56702.1 hypothetical protein LZQ00_02535 [Sphingobacterium sp. SRCM116780]
MGFLTEEDIRRYFIDDRNYTLWESMVNQFRIGVNDDYKFYQLDYQDENSDVYILTDKMYSKSLFTHELLHLQLRSKGLNTADYFQMFSQDVFKAFALTICNCIEHVLFFDDFVEMGYPRETFVMDYDNQEYNIDQAIKMYSDIKTLNDQAILKLVIFYLYWTFKNEEYMGIDRASSLDWLKKVESKLLISCNRMYDEIISFDLESTNVQNRFNVLVSKYLRRRY